MNGKLAIGTVLVLAFILRGITAPNQQPKASAADHPEQPETQTQSLTPYRAMASTVFTQGVKPAIYARAAYLYRRAQSEGNALGWLQAHYSATAGDIAYLKSSLGSPTGDADQFSQLIGRSTELAAVSLAIDWMLNSNPRLDKAAVSLDPILSQYSATKGGKP